MFSIVATPTIQVWIARSIARAPYWMLIIRRLRGPGSVPLLIHSQAPMSKPPSCGRGRARVVRCHDVGEIEAGINGPAPRLEVEVGRARTHKVWITK